jgi:hypothetical protein
LTLWMALLTDILEVTSIYDFSILYVFQYRNSKRRFEYNNNICHLIF